MAVLRQSGPSPFADKTMTTRGYRDSREGRQCQGCGKLKTDAIFTMDANGKMICSDCAGPKHARVLDTVAHRADCEDGLCGCEPVDGVLDDATLPED